MEKGQWYVAGQCAMSVFGRHVPFSLLRSIPDISLRSNWSDVTRLAD